MKTPITAALALPFLLIAGSLSASAQNTQFKIEIEDIQIQVQQTPQFNVNGVKGKRVKPRDWIEIEAELKVESAAGAGQLNAGFLKEMRAEWHAIISDKFERDRKKAARHLTGGASFQNIRAKGDSVFVSAYISPDTLEQLSGKEKAQDNDVLAVALVISGSNLSPSSVLKKAVGAGSNQEWWVGGKYQQLRDQILAKSKTPFAPLWTDRYPNEQPER